MNELRDWEHFQLSYDPNPSSKYPNGYWSCYAKPGYDGSGHTAIDAMAECIIAMSKALIRKDDEDS